MRRDPVKSRGLRLSELRPDVRTRSFFVVRKLRCGITVGTVSYRDFIVTDLFDPPVHNEVSFARSLAALYIEAFPFVSSRSLHHLASSSVQ
jgi:hypothetical protein